MAEMRGMLAGLMRVVDTLVTNQVRQPQGTQEVGSSRGDPLIASTTPVVEVCREPITKGFYDLSTTSIQ